MRTQHLNTFDDTNKYMGESRVIGAGNRPFANKGYAGLKAAADVHSKSANEDLYIVSVNCPEKLNLEGEGGVLRQIDMDDTLEPDHAIDFLVDGLYSAKSVGEMLHTHTGKSVGISKYDGSAAKTHIRAQEAIRIAQHIGKNIIVYEEQDILGELAEKFSTQEGYEGRV